MHVPDIMSCLLLQLAAPADIYVNDAFGCAHRAHASTAGVAAFLQPAVAGFLMKKVCTACLAWTPLHAVTAAQKLESDVDELCIE